MARSTIDRLGRSRLRTRLEAAVLDRQADALHRRHGARKQAVISAMDGPIVEIGPGTGVNMRYYPPGTRVIGIEPNPNMHDRLRASAERHDVDLEIRLLAGEAIDVADDVAGGVVGTLVLCGVEDPVQVVAEVRRVLRPGGTYLFHEHVVAPAGSLTRAVQRVVKRPHHWAANGCVVDRDLAGVIQAAGFAQVDIETFDAGLESAYARTQIIGTATA